MGDLKNPRVIWAKGFLFLFLGIVAATILLIQTASWNVAILLLIAIWAFCRFYYFAFYVIEHYVDGEYRFAGLWSFVQYALKKRSN